MPADQARALASQRVCCFNHHMIKVYIYAKCSQCRHALHWLKEEGIAYESMPIRETPPSIKELKTALQHHDGNLRKIFNTSGLDYRSMGLKDKLPTMTEAQALKLLNQNGNLIKRPLLIGDGFALGGFHPEQWKKTFGR